MEKDMIINQVRLVYDYAYAELEKSVKGHTLIESNTLDQIVAGLWLIVKDTLGESWSLKNKVEFDEGCEEAPCEESGDDVPAVEHDDEDHDIPAVEHYAPSPSKRYCGEAMIKDDLVRLSKYDLHDLDFKVSVDHVGWKEDPNRDRVPVWRVHVEFMRDDRTSSCGFFMFNEDGSAIDNSVRAFDRMVENSPSVFGFLKEKTVECEQRKMKQGFFNSMMRDFLGRAPNKEQLDYMKSDEFMSEFTSEQWKEWTQRVIIPWSAALASPEDMGACKGGENEDLTPPIEPEQSDCKKKEA